MTNCFTISYYTKDTRVYYNVPYNSEVGANLLKVFETKKKIKRVIRK